MSDEIKGKVRLRFEDGTYRNFNNIQEAQKWMQDNKYHVIGQVDPVEVTLPEQEIIAPLPNKGIDYLQGTVPYVATPSDISALVGESRIKGVQRALERNPDALDNYDIFKNVVDFYTKGTGGIVNRLSPTQNIRLLYDIITGENVIDSMLGNNGIVPDNVAAKQPVLSTIANVIGDVGLGTGALRTYDYSKGYKLAGKGASSEVYVSNNPFNRKYVYKVSDVSPEEMAEINKLPRTVPSEHIGNIEGKHIYKQQAVTPTFKPKLDDFIRLARTKGFFQKLFNGDTETVFYNPETDKVMLDLNGNWGVDKYGRTVLYDASLLDLKDYLSLLKTGGKLNTVKQFKKQKRKLIKKNNNG